MEGLKNIERMPSQPNAYPTPPQAGNPAIDGGHRFIQVRLILYFRKRPPKH
jgi:hypothetical protein